MTVPAIVSVIIPAHNCEKYVAEAIDSVLAQTYPAVECIVVDDGSTDRTAEVVKSYGERVRYVYQDNAERSAARNNGLRCATGEYVSFLDADDYLAPEKIFQQVALLGADSRLEIVYSRVCYFRDDKERRFYDVRRPAPIGDILETLIYSNFITVHAPLIRAKAVADAGGFNPRRNRYEDWEFFLRLAARGARFGFIDSCHAFVRMHAENTVHDRLRMFEAKLQVAEEFVRDHNHELQARGINPDGVAAFHRADYGRLLILNGHPDEGREMIRDACRCSDFPHRHKFLLFAFAGGICGSRFMAGLQVLVDRVYKYRKGTAVFDGKKGRRDD